MNLAEDVRRRRHDKGLTQSALAELSGIQQAHISQIERGRRRPSLPTLLKLRDALELTSDEWTQWIDGAAA